VRLFVAITPPRGVLDEIEARVAPLRPAWPALRWTGRPAWHVTLAFLGEVGEQAAGALGPRLERAARRHPGLPLSVAGAGAFPAPGRARVLWTGIGGDRPALAALARSVAAGARRAGAPPPDEDRRFRPHLTLARCREPADVGRLVEALAGFAGAPWTAAEIQLIRSHPGDPGSPPRYETLGAWPLGAARPSPHPG
jgi:RNA 2',3'-cyclic 3'-phosphodiesterase